VVSLAPEPESLAAVCALEIAFNDIGQSRSVDDARKWRWLDHVVLGGAARRFDQRAIGEIVSDHPNRLIKLARTANPHVLAEIGATRTGHLSTMPNRAPAA